MMKSQNLYHVQALEAVSLSGHFRPREYGDYVIECWLWDRFSCLNIRCVVVSELAGYKSQQLLDCDVILVFPSGLESTPMEYTTVTKCFSAFCKVMRRHKRSKENKNFCRVMHYILRQQTFSREGRARTLNVFFFLSCEFGVTSIHLILQLNLLTHADIGGEGTLWW